MPPFFDVPRRSRGNRAFVTPLERGLHTGSIDSMKYHYIIYEKITIILIVITDPHSGLPDSDRNFRVYPPSEFSVSVMSAPSQSTVCSEVFHYYYKCKRAD